MLRRWTAITILVIAAVSAPVALMTGCDVMDQDMDVYIPGSPPGEADEEDTAQTFFEENH